MKSPVHSFCTGTKAFGQLIFNGFISTLLLAATALTCAGKGSKKRIPGYGSRQNHTRSSICKSRTC
jgi:hypothetical protein